MLRTYTNNLIQSDQREVLWQYGQLLLVIVGVCYPVVRMLLPGAARVLVLTPLLLLLLWAAWRITQPRQAFHASPGVPLLLCGLSLMGSSLLAVADPVTVAASLFDWIELAVVLFLTVYMLAAGWRPQWFISAVLLASSAILLASTWALVEWWVQWALLWQPGEPWLPVGFRKQIAGNHPNQAAMLINIGLPLVIAALWRARAHWQRWLWGGWLLLATLVLVYSSSRGSWLALVVVVALMLAPLLWSAWRGRRWWRVGVTLLLASGYTALFAAVLWVNLQEVQAQRNIQPVQISGGSDQAGSDDTVDIAQTTSNLSNATGRERFWQRALDFFAERPLLGVGPGGYAVMYASVEPGSQIFRVEHAHSLYLTTLSESGLFGVGALCLLALAVGRFWWRGWQQATPLLPAPDQPRQPAQPDRVWLLACVAAVAGLATHGIVDVPVTYTIGIAAVLAAAAAQAGGAWQLVTEESAASDRPRLSISRLPALIIRHPLPVALAVLAVLAWGSGVFLLMQRSAQAARSAEARAAIRSGDAARAVELYSQNIARYPWDASAYSGRATALAWLALDEPEVLPIALAAQDEADRYDPTNLSVPLNRSALLLEQGQRAQAEDLLQAFIPADRGHRPEAYLLLASSREQAGDEEQARASWQEALRRHPPMAESAACLQSEICPTLPLPDSEYAALVQARQLQEQPDAAALDQIEQLAHRWDSIDIWAVGALAAEQAGDEQAARRFLTAAIDESELITKDPTRQLALVLLHDAMQRDDRAALRSLVQRWIPAPDMQLVPQVTRLSVTTTEHRLAEALVEAAALLDAPAMLARAQRYLAYVEAAMGY